MCLQIYKIFCFKISRVYSENMYNKIMDKIGNYLFLDEEELEFIKQLPKEDLTNIIEIYNNYTLFVNESIEKSKKL